MKQHWIRGKGIWKNRRETTIKPLQISGKNYELIRKAWKKDVMKLKRSVKKEEILHLFGIQPNR